jgi:hypothetical protein
MVVVGHMEVVVTRGAEAVVLEAIQVTRVAIVVVIPATEAQEVQDQVLTII